MESIDFAEKRGLPRGTITPQLQKAMTLYSISQQKSDRGAFTLMELLVVITIIMILAGMAFPGAKGVLDRARKAGAENQALQVRSSIAAYYTEYRRYPLASTGGGESAIRTNETLMDILLGADGNKYNPRGISFFAGKKAKGGKGGLVMSGSGGGKLVDPWGELFYVIMDTDYNNRVTAPFSKTNEAGNNEIPQNVIVWSTGPDGAESDDVKDNITTW